VVLIYLGLGPQVAGNRSPYTNVTDLSTQTLHKECYIKWF
jgi:hypothetical protein